ncbi:MAG: hypothetical protein GY862_25845 [Gammaproteobacteria bacterium]|nr:hypothetical protein [Gammaproteobacteria bacterium]
MPKKIFKEGKKYTFSDYFEMGNPTEDIVGALGYSFSTQNLTLPVSNEINMELIDDLRSSYYLLIPKISVNSETAKRELMISPVLHAVLKIIDAKLDVEYPVDVNERLSGSVDYLFRSKQDLIVIEAKKGDLEKGFNQLAAKMIAVDQYEESESPIVLYGAISIGEVWRFAILERKSRNLIKDIHTFRFPEDLEDIFSIIKGILVKGA